MGFGLVEIVQDPQAWIIAACGQKKIALFGFCFTFNKTRSALLDPLVNQLLRESPLAGNPRAWDLAGLRQEIDFLIVNPQVTRYFPGVHQLGHSLLGHSDSLAILHKKGNKLTNSYKKSFEGLSRQLFRSRLTQ